MSKLWRHTYAAGIEGFESYFSGFNPDTGYFYIDRVNYRLPDWEEHQQGGLFLHTDCDPRAPFDDPSKWRPIQASVVLTDSLTPTSGIHSFQKQLEHTPSDYRFLHQQVGFLLFPGCIQN